jgi:GntR family transcriptional regulator
LIHLDYRDTRPIYQQVKDGLRRLMVTGVLRCGDRLPSVRQLATELTINPNTIARAYSELEAEGFVCTVTGKGTFVAEGQGQSLARKSELTEKLRPLLQELRELGMTKEELEKLWEGGEEHA